MNIKVLDLLGKIDVSDLKKIISNSFLNIFKNDLVKALLKPTLEKTVNLFINLIKVMSEDDKLVLHLYNSDNTEVLEIELEVLKNSVDKIIELNNEVQNLKSLISLEKSRQEVDSV